MYLRQPFIKILELLNIVNRALYGCLSLAVFANVLWLLTHHSLQAWSLSFDVLAKVILIDKR